MVLRFYKQWFKVAFTHSLGIADLYSSIASSALAVLAHYSAWVQSIMNISSWEIPVFFLAGVMLIRILLAPYWIWSEAQQKIKKLERIDDSDLEHLLNGFFCEDIFTYKSEITPCKPFEFKTKYEFEKLRNNWTEISVPAPKNSWAEIKFHFSNGHPRGQRDFYVLSPEGKTLNFDIYAQNYILLDSRSCFSFKVTWSDDYEINDAVSLRIAINSWRK